MISNIKSGLVNFFGAIGYLVVSLQWLFVLLAYFGFLKSLELVNVQEPDPVPVQVTTTEPSVGVMIFGALIVVSMVVLSVYLFVKMPSMVAKTSKKVVLKAATTVVPAVLKAQHKPVTKKRRKLLTPRIVMCIKLLVIILPLALVYFSQGLDSQSIEFEVLMVASLWLAGFSLLAFGVQYILARSFSLDSERF